MNEMNDFKKELKDEVKEAVKEVKDTAVEELKKVKDEVKAESVAWYNKLPLWGKVTALLLVLGGFFAYEKYVAKQPETVTVVVNATAPVAIPNVVNGVQDKAAVEKVDANKLFAKYLRHQTVKQLQAEGIDGKPLSREAAIALASNLDDDELVAVGEISGVVEGRVLDTLANVVKFLIEHKEQIRKLISLIIMLLAAFA